jgi:uncharacterized protein (DUF305 family)
MTSPPTRRRPTILAAALLAVVVALTSGAAGCSSADDDDATSTTTARSGEATEDAVEPGQATVDADDDGRTRDTRAMPTEMAATGTDREWCEAVITFDQQSDDVVDESEMASFVEELQSLAEDAPEAIAEPMSELAAATEELYELSRTDPEAAMSPPPELEARGETASEAVSAWIEENCGGYVL